MKAAFHHASCKPALSWVQRAFATSH